MNPGANDSDNDGMPDGWEVANGLDPTDPWDSIFDMDGDGIDLDQSGDGFLERLWTNLDEYRFESQSLNGYNSTNPKVGDTDNCPDVTEAGFTDPDNDSIIGTSPTSVDNMGRVTGISNGYTIPDTDYSIGAPILLNTPFEDVAFCEASTSTISIDSTADTFQWEVSSDGGTNWTSIIDNTTYNGATTKDLEISNLQLSLDNNQYRVFLQRAGNTCNDTSNAITLTVEPLPTVTALVELKQCDDDTDGFSLFNLNEAASDISTNYLNETFVFYPSLLDVENNTNAYTPAEALAFRNRFVTTEFWLG